MNHQFPHPDAPALDRLDAEGYLVLENFTPPETLMALRRRTDELLAQEGDHCGSEYKQEPQTRRLANLVDKGEIFTQVIALPEILACVGRVLGPQFKLSSLNFRSADPYSDWVQPLHCDVGAVPDEKGFWVCNVIWLLDDFTTENGAPRFVPGSHRSGKLPQEVLADPSAPHPDEVLLTGRAGTVMVMNTHLWHGATANRTGEPRRALHSFYCRWDKPQQQYQKQLLRPSVQQSLSPELRRLLALDDPLNDDLSSRLSGMSGFMK
ncbi:MAG TPA: phytanoyl-CoA dioxygenase family protein [Blastocatellia bacterium]|nr:phytanoyl-CoA dioxygenase family protein [Blastocatellia bacterium]